MADTGNQDVISDEEIPIEIQVDFLRKSIFDRDLATYKVLKIFFVFLRALRGKF